MAETKMLQTILNKIEGMDKRFDKIDGYFDVVDKRFDQVDHKFDHVDSKFDRIDQRFKNIDNRFDKMDKRFDKMDDRFEQVDNRFEQVDNRFDKTEERFVGLETLVDTIAIRVVNIEEELKEKVTKKDLKNLENKFFDKIDSFLKSHGIINDETFALKNGYIRLDKRLTIVEQKLDI